MQHIYVGLWYPDLQIHQIPWFPAPCEYGYLELAMLYVINNIVITICNAIEFHQNVKMAKLQTRCRKNHQWEDENVCKY